MYILNGDPLPPGQSFIVGDVQYPGSILTLWTDDDLAALGVRQVDPPDPEALPLDDLRTAFHAAVTAKREAVFAAGFTPTAGPLAGHTLQVRNDQDKINWLTSATSYSAAVAGGHGAMPGATFRTMANDTVVVTFAEGAEVIVQDMAAWGQAIMQRSWDLKDEIDAASDLDALEAIDIEVGWP